MKLPILFCCVVAALVRRAESFPTGDPPMFTAALEDTVVANPDGMGGGAASFSLECQVTGDPTPTIAWFQEGTEIEGETGTTLTVSPITATDATLDGVEYYCEASNSFGRIRSRRASVQLATFGAWAVSGSQTIDARLGGFSMAIPCDPPTANPSPIVFWQADGVNITAGDPLAGGAADRIQILPSGHLVIHALEASDVSVSQYKCSVSNANTHSLSQRPKSFTLAVVTELPANREGTRLHVFNHAPTGQAERGETFFIFNVVQPTVDLDIFSNDVPNIAVQNQRYIYFVEDFEMFDAAQPLEIRYFASGNPDVLNLGILSTTITMIDPADVTSVSGPQRILTGRSVTLTCNIAALPDATVIWYKDGIQITSGTRRGINTTPDTNTQLTIDLVTMDDNGMYQCFVSNVHGDDVGTISLQVRDHELEISQPLARETPFVEGDNRTLTASVLSDTQPTMTWSVNGQDLTETNSTYEIGSIQMGSENDRGLTEYNRSLSIFFLNTTYEGEYKLVAEVSSDGLVVETTGYVLQERLTTSVIVELVDSPCLVVGTNVTLRCQPDGVPRSTVTWFLDNVQLSSNDPHYFISDDPDFTITIIGVVPNDARSYTCNAVNTLTNGTMSGTVSGSAIFGLACEIPTIAQVTDDTVDLSPTLLTGATLTLTCTAMGTPLPDISWYRGNSRIISSSQTQITDTMVDATTRLSILTVSSVSTGDSGTYECRVENVASTTSLQYQVTVVLEVFFDRISYFVPETAAATLTLQTSTPSYSFPFTVTVDTMNITATAGEDYTPGIYTVTFQPGQTEAMLTIPTMDDSIPEMDEVYTATITDTSVDRVVIGSPGVANVTILDNEDEKTIRAWGFCRVEVGPTGILWPDTPVGQTATQPCLCEASQSNNATRSCSSDGLWAPEPDVALCQLSPVIGNLCSAANVSDQIEILTNISLVEDLNQVLTTGDALLLTETVNDVIDGAQIDIMTARVLVSVLDEAVAAVGENVNIVDFGAMVLETLDRVANAFPVMENGTIVEENVVVEVVSMMQSILQLNGLRANQLGGGNVVTLPPALFRLPGIPSIPRVTAVSINNRNLVPPRNRNSRLRANILSINLVNGPSGGLRGLRNDERIQLNFDRDANTNDVANGAVSCAFYDIAAADWSTEGCEMVSEDTTSMTCECNHLTAFSILQSPAVPTISVTLIVTLSVVGGVVLLIILATGGAYLIWRSRQKAQVELKVGEL